MQTGKVEFASRLDHQRLPGTNIEMSFIFVGDEDFLLKQSLINQQQNIFNYGLSRVRGTVDNAFGILAMSP